MIVESIFACGGWVTSLMLLILSGLLWARARGLRLSRYTIAALEKSIEKHEALAEVLHMERDLNKSLVERAPVIVLHLDPQGVIQYVNPYFERITGFRLEEIKGRDWFGTFVPERDRDRIRTLFHVAIHEAPIRGNISPILLRDGEEREIEWNDQLLRNDQGEGFGIVAVGVDVTERRLTERELLIKQAAIDSSINGIAFADLEGNLSFVNQSFLSLWGLESPEGVLGRPAIEFWVTPEAAQDIVNALYERGSWMGEMRAVSRNGLPFDVQISAHMVTDRAGEPLCMMASFIDISSRKLLERSLRASELRYRTTVECEPECVKLIDSQCNLLEMNRAGLAFVEASSLDEVRGRSVLELVLPDYRQRFQAGMEAVLRGERDVQQFEIVGLKGGRRWLEQHAVLFRSAGGVADGDCILAVTRDITEHVRIQDDLRRHEAHLLNILDSMFTFVVLFDMEGRITEVNRVALHASGLKAEDVLGKLCWETNWWNYSTESQETVKEALRRAAQGTTVRGDYRVRVKGGRLVDVYVIYSPLKDAAGQVEQIIGSGVDITQRKVSENLLRESESKLREAQRLTQTGSWELDLVTNKLHWSDEIYRIFEVEKDGFGATYESFLSLVHPEDRAAVDSAYIGSTHRGEGYQYIHRLLMTDGRIKHVEERGETEYSQEGRPLRTRGTVQDVTDRVLAEKKIEAQLLEKEYLLREVHHRVKNNLQVVSSLLYLQRQRADSPAFSNLLLESETRIAAMSMVHERLYNSGDFSGIDFREYSRELVDFLMLAYGADPDQIKVAISAEIPPLPLDFAITCGLIMNEILSNSLKHAFPDLQRGTIIIQMGIDNGTDYLLDISDDGPGFSTGPGQHAPDSLGLRLIERLVMQNHGTIRREGPPGTRYLLRFPESGPMFPVGAASPHR